MIRPRKMKRVELTILDRDVDRVIEYLGREALFHVSLEDGVEAQTRDLEALKRANEWIERIRGMADWLGFVLPAEPDPDAGFPGATENALVEKIAAGTGALRKREQDVREERRRVESTLNEIQAFGNIDAAWADMDRLSYLAVRIGHLDPKGQDELRAALGDRAVVIPLDGDAGTGVSDGGAAAGGGSGRILAAASRKGRFALDSELKKRNFEALELPPDYRGGIPPEMLEGLKKRLSSLDRDLEALAREKENCREEWGRTLVILASDYRIARQVEELKAGLRATSSVYLLSGWVAADVLPLLVRTLEERFGGRVAVRAWAPEELPDEKLAAVPVSLRHGSFVQGFARLVFSYGAPLYGTIDPTPFVAFFFAVLFGIMFGDLGQGFVLFLLGLLTGKKGPQLLAGFRIYSVPLLAIGTSSMVMGLLTGEVFAVEGLLSKPTEMAAGFFMRLFGVQGDPPHRILHLMPESGSLEKLFYFFGFTVSVGIVLNSIGLLVNITNLFILKKYEKALFAKTGLAGLLLFWYAVFIALRLIPAGPGGGGRFVWFDIAGLAVPAFCIFFGPLIWRLLSRQRPVLEESILVFCMEGFVEVLETASTYVSNTVSFLRVGAFALSHAVLSFIIFTLSGMVGKVSGGPVLQLLILIAGNAIIIVLEGMIVAIQVVRLQYYEFFSKFFTETGVEWNPFRFRKGEET